MATVELSASNFESTLKENQMVFVDFWAEWCGPCRSFGPVFEAAAEANGDIVFGKVDTEAQMELAGAADIQSIPTLMAFKDGVLVFRESGAVPAAVFNDIVAQLRELDMSEIHEEIAAANRKPEDEDEAVSA